MPGPATTYAELADAMLWVGASGYGEPPAWFCRDTGKFLYGDDPEQELPADIDDETRYLALPDKRDLDLGQALRFQFTQEELPDRYDDVRNIFRHRGAYARFQELLDRHGKLSAWYAYEERVTQATLRQWCADNDLPLTD